MDRLVNAEGSLEQVSGRTRFLLVDDLHGGRHLDEGLQELPAVLFFFVAPIFPTFMRFEEVATRYAARPWVNHALAHPGVRRFLLPLNPVRNGGSSHESWSEVMTDGTEGRETFRELLHMAGKRAMPAQFHHVDSHEDIRQTIERSVAR